MKFPRRPIPARWFGIALLLAIAPNARAGDLSVQFPANWNVVAAEVRAAHADTPITAKVQPSEARFLNLNSADRWNVKLTLDDGRVFQGVDLAWYNADPADPDAADLADDDRQQILAILNLPSFYNHSDLLILQGDHDRATALVQRVRDQPFAGDTGQNVIWRAELWYMKNEHGGWVKENNLVLRRERFDNPDQFHQATAKLKWLAELGGITVPTDGKTTLTVPADSPTTQTAPLSAH